MTLTELLSNAKHAVVLTGAGISTLSGIPDFRGAGGLYTRTDIDANKLFDLDYFMKDPTYYYEHSKDFLYNLEEKEPNIVHKTLARLEKEGIIHAVITQNIDLLHQKAGSKKVLELHGSPLLHHCLRCGKSWTFEEIAPPRARRRSARVRQMRRHRETGHRVLRRRTARIRPHRGGTRSPRRRPHARARHQPSPCTRPRPCPKSPSSPAAKSPSSTATPPTLDRYATWIGRDLKKEMEELKI